MTLSRTIAALLLLVVLPAHDAAANNWGSPMSFTVSPYTGGFSIIADGDFVADTPEQFERFLAQHPAPRGTEVLFTSRGGALGAGVRLGEIIRAHQFSTEVASKTRVQGLEEPGTSPFTRRLGFDLDFGTYPGYCISACTFAFLGGVERYVWPGSLYAVHQVAIECEDPATRRPGSTTPPASRPGNACPHWDTAFADAQVMSASLVEYVEKMGVDPALLTEVARATPDDINRLSEAQLRKYKVVFRPGGTEWNYQTTMSGQFFLRIRETKEWKTNELQFFCSREGRPDLVLVVLYDLSAQVGLENADAILANARNGVEFVWYPSGFQTFDPKTRLFQEAPMLRLADDEILRYPFMYSDTIIGLAIAISPRILDILRTADGFSVTNGLFNKASVFYGGVSPVDREKMDGFIASCR